MSETVCVRERERERERKRKKGYSDERYGEKKVEIKTEAVS